MAENEVKVVGWESLKDFTSKIFIQAGMPPEDAGAEAGALIWANLRAIDSHGVLRIPWYLSNIDNGVMNPEPKIQVIKETPATILVDADRALGPVVTIKVVNMVMEKGRKVGICWALIRNLTHQGALGYYSQMMAEKGMAGIVFVCSAPSMAPFGAKASGVHNSPIAISVPAKRHRTLNLDMATSLVAGGKLWLAIDKNMPIPKGWALDKEGNPTTDPKNVGALLPVGGPKGSGLAMMFECLSSVMAGNPLLEPILFGREMASPPPRTKGKSDAFERVGPKRPHIQNSVVVAIDISTFTDLERYKEHIDNLIDGIKALPKADGFQEIFVPGEPEERAFLERSRNGIPLPGGTIKNLKAVSEQFGVKLPLGLR